jgi:prepilin-type N-terminal cleavage/methylation domain-containing protein
LLAVRRGFSLTELAIAVAVVGLVITITLPRLARLLDGVAVERAAAELTTALAITRNTAVIQARRARLSIAADSLRLDRWDGELWAPVRRWSGPAQLGVTATVSNPVVAFSPLGVGWGAANTRIVLERGLGRATITASRAGRIKRW